MPVRALTAVVLACVATAMACTPALARIIEVGKTATDNPPSCPSSPCLAVSRTTGYQVKVGTERDMFVAPASGKIVAWSIALGKPGKKQRAFFESNFGGAALAGISILKPGRKSYGRVTGQSPVQALTPYFGQTVQFPLGRALNVKKGYVVALTVPSWAPALAVGLGNDTSWRASRPKAKCTDTGTQTAQQRLGGLAQYRCLYHKARLTYSATLITTPRSGSTAG